MKTLEWASTTLLPSTGRYEGTGGMNNNRRIHQGVHMLVKCEQLFFVFSINIMLHFNKQACFFP